MTETDTDTDQAENAPYGLGLAATIAGVITAIYGAIFVTSSHSVDQGGSHLFETLAPFFPILLIITLILCCVAGFAKQRALGVIGGLLTLVPLLFLFAS